MKCDGIYVKWKKQSICQGEKVRERENNQTREQKG